MENSKAVQMIADMNGEEFLAYAIENAPAIPAASPDAQIETPEWGSEA